MIDLYQIFVESHRADDDGHSQISIEANTEPRDENNELEGFTDRQILEAALYSGGIVARIGMMAIEHIMFEAQRHGCRPHVVRMSPNDPDHLWIERGCHVCAPETLLRPSLGYEPAPAVWITIPTDSLPAWLERIRTWLEWAAAEEQMPAREENAS